MVDKPRIAVVFHHIGPYHHARLNAAADRLSVTGFLNGQPKAMTRGAQRSRLRGITKFHFSGSNRPLPGNAKLKQAFWTALEQARPDVVAVNGWNNFGSLIFRELLCASRIPVVVMSESSRQDEHRTSWKEAIKRRIAGLYSAALVGGSVTSSISLNLDAAGTDLYGIRCGR